MGTLNESDSISAASKSAGSGEQLHLGKCMQGSLSCFLISATWRARVGGFPDLPAMPCESWYARRRAARAGDCGAAPSAIMVSSAGGEPAKKLRHFLLGFDPEAAAYSRPLAAQGHEDAEPQRHVSVGRCLWLGHGAAGPELQV